MLHHIHEWQIVQWFYQEDIIYLLTQDLQHRLTHIRIQVHGIYEIHILILLCQVLDSMADIQKSLAEVLTAMTSNQHHTTIAIQTLHIIAHLGYLCCYLISKCLIFSQSLYHHLQCINHSVTRHDDLVLIHMLTQEVLFGQWRRREVMSRDATRDQTVHFLWPWTVDIACTQTRLHMSYGYLLVERR